MHMHVHVHVHVMCMSMCKYALAHRASGLCDLIHSTLGPWSSLYTLKMKRQLYIPLYCLAARRRAALCSLRWSLINSKQLNQLATGTGQEIERKARKRVREFSWVR